MDRALLNVITQVILAQMHPNIPVAAIDPRGFVDENQRLELEEVRRIIQYNTTRVLDTPKLPLTSTFIEQQLQANSQNVPTTARKPLHANPCYVCYDAFDSESGIETRGAIWCKQCGTNIHPDCWATWKRQSHSDGKVATCGWCRREWFY